MIAVIAREIAKRDAQITHLEMQLQMKNELISRLQDENYEWRQKARRATLGEAVARGLV